MRPVIYIVLALAIMSLVSFDGVAYAEPPPPSEEALVLKAEPGTVGVPVGTEAEARVAVGSCTVANQGEITANKITRGRSCICLGKRTYRPRLWGPYKNRRDETRHGEHIRQTHL